MTRSLLLLLLPLLAAAGVGSGCKGDDPAAPGGDLPTGVVPDFSLVDVNPTSATSGQAVSPRDRLQQVSAWYFGHAT